MKWSKRLGAALEKWHAERELASCEAERNKQIEQLSKIAQMPKLDENDLLAEYDHHLPTTQFACCREGCDDLVAWRSAVDAADRRQYRKRETAEQN